MKLMKRIAMVAALGGSVALTSCGGTSAADGGTGGGAGGGGGSSTECFSGTPATNTEFLNACVDSSIEKVLKTTSWRDPGVTLPALP